jgi:hypothetical protein
LLRVTLDTNVVNEKELSRIEAACAGRDVEIAYTTVTDREQEGSSFPVPPAAVLETAVWDESRWDRSVWGAATIPETAVIGESRIGKAVIGGDEVPSRLEAILAVINGDRLFPPPGERDSLKKDQRGRFRDAMILEAHAREGCDIFVTNDRKDFIRHGRREQLEKLCSTRIMTVEQFCDLLSS